MGGVAFLCASYEVDGLGAITYVLPLYLHGAMHHVEAGAWWSAGGAGAGRLAR